MTRKLLFAVALLTVIRILLGGLVDLGDAEAYYQSWARRPSLGYLDHPPLVAWLIMIVRPLGESALFTRLPSALLFSGALLAVAKLAQSFDGRASLALLLVLATPFLHIGGFGANPDVPLACFGALALLTAWNGQWLLTGAALGLALLSKASALSYFPAVAYLALHRERKLLFSLALALLIASPPVLWNAQHGWPTLHFQFVERGVRFEPLLGLARFIGGQLAYAGPPLILLLATLVYRVARSQEGQGWQAVRDRFVLWAALPSLIGAVVAFMLYPSAEPHWTLPAYLPLLARAASLPPSRLLRIVIAFGLALVALLYALILTPIFPRLIPAPLYTARFDLTNELYGWEQVGRALHGRPAAASHYTMCAQLERVSAGPVFCAGRRRSQYDLWPKPKLREVIFVSDERFPARAQSVLPCSQAIREQDVVIQRGERIVRRFVLERCLYE